MRLLIVSDSPWTRSGYGVQIAILAPRLAALGHDVALLAAYGLGGGRTTWEGLPVFPGGLDPFGNDVIGPAAREWRADVVITLKDTWVYDPAKWGPGIRWCPLTPVDHDPCPPSVVEKLRQSWQPIAYAKDAHRSLRLAGFDPAYAPHGYDPAVFSPMEKADARKQFGFPLDAFLIGMVAVNRGGIPSRKAWPQNIEGFAEFRKKHPDALMIAHTATGEDGQDGSVNLNAVASLYGVGDVIAFPDQQQYKAGFPDSYLRAFYSAMDVLLAPSLGEGFGVPTLEAQAHGTPVIVGDWCASSELCFSGWRIPNNDRGRLKFLDGQYSHVFIPQPSAITAALEKAYAARHTASVREKAIKGAAAYQIDNVVTAHWKPLLETWSARIASEVSRGYLRIIRKEALWAA